MASSRTIDSGSGVGSEGDETSTLRDINSNGVSLENQGSGTTLVENTVGEHNNESGNDNGSAKDDKSLVRGKSIMHFVRKELDSLEFHVPGVKNENDLGNSKAQNLDNKEGKSLNMFSTMCNKPTTFPSTLNRKLDDSMGSSTEDTEVEDDLDSSPVKPICGIRCKVGLRWIVIGYNVLLVLVLGIVLIWNQILNVDSVEDSCQGGIELAFEITVLAVLNATESNIEALSDSLLGEVRSNLSLSVLQEPQMLVDRVYQYFILQRITINPEFDGRIYGNYWNQSILPQLFQSLNYSNLFTDNLYVAYINEEFVGINNVMRRIKDTTLRRTSPPIDDPPGITQLSTCSVDLLLGETIIGCNPPANYTPTQRPYFVPQVRLLNQSEGQPLKSTWSDIYVFVPPNVSEPIITSVVGLSFTYPLSRSLVYDELMEGVIVADVTFASLSTFCNNSVQSTINLLKPTENLDQFLFYVVSSDGVLVAASDTIDYMNQGDNIHLVNATESKNEIIANVSKRLDFDSILNGTQTLFYKVGGGNCPSISNLHLFTGGGALSSDVVEEAIEGCIYVAVGDVFSINYGIFQAEEQLAFKIITTIPYTALVNELLEKIADAEALSLTTFEEENNALKRGIFIESIVVLVLIVFSGVFLGIVVAIVLTKSLRQLVSSMRRLRNLDFRRKDYRKHHSRIREINTLQESFSSLRATIKVFSKFIPTTVVKNIVGNKEKARQLHVKKRVVTVFFSDIQAFTSISEALNKKDLLRLLTTYLTYMSRTIESYNGVIGEILGDGILAFWNTPDDVQNHAARACASALAQQQVLELINEQFKDMLEENNLQPLKIRIGIHTGEVLTGIFGSKNKFKFGCMGDAVNLASRLEGICKLYGVGIICSGDTRNALPSGNFELRELDLVQVKGKSQDTQLFEVLAMTSEITDLPENVPYNGLESSTTYLQFSKPSLSKFAGNTSRWISGKAKSGNSPETERIQNEITWGPVRSLSSSDIEIRDTYEKALHMFQHGDVEAAKVLLLNLKNIYGLDDASVLLLDRVQEALTKGQGYYRNSAWTGVLKLTEKEF